MSKPNYFGVFLKCFLECFDDTHFGVFFFNHGFWSVHSCTREFSFLMVFGFHKHIKDKLYPIKKKEST